MKEGLITIYIDSEKKSHTSGVASGLSRSSANDSHVINPSDLLFQFQRMLALVIRITFPLLLSTWPTILFEAWCVDFFDTQPNEIGLRTFAAKRNSWETEEIFLPVLTPLPDKIDMNFQCLEIWVAVLRYV